MGAVGALRDALIGRVVPVPREVLARYPELRAARWRRGGLPPRIAGWCMGQRCVAAITLWRTIWLAPHVRMSDELLLHELRHVHQFQSSVTFPFRYLWEIARRGYHHNRYEVDARAYAASRVRADPTRSPRGDA
ncbi:MAG TPA: hypothetical protein VFS05_09155 [Gemmatimonadaceae bacterium]|nr:hypothetical protein [Gemmatimonadaceae bacterium]